MAQFFCGEDFAERGDNARLEFTPAELRQISSLMHENAKLKTEMKLYNMDWDVLNDNKETFSKVEVLTMLSDIQLEIEGLQTYKMFAGEEDTYLNRQDARNIIRQKIQALDNHTDNK